MMSASVPLRRASGGGDDSAQHSDHENAPAEHHHHHHRYIASNPNPSNEQHLFTLAALLLIGFVTIFSLYQLTGIFVPFLVSFFLAQLLEPVALWLAKPRGEVAKWIWHREYITGVEEVEVADAALGPVILEQVIEGAGDLGSLDLRANYVPSDDVVVGGPPSSTDFRPQTTGTHSHSPASSSGRQDPAQDHEEQQGPPRARPRPSTSRTCSRACQNALRRTYIVITDILILLFCLALLFGVVFWLVFGLTNALSDAPEVFQNYLNGGKLKALIAFLEQHGVNVTPEDLIKRVEGPLESIVGGLLNFLETSIMVIMMLCFLLVASLTESHPKLVLSQRKKRRRRNRVEDGGGEDRDVAGRVVGVAGVAGDAARSSSRSRREHQLWSARSSGAGSSSGKNVGARSGGTATATGRGRTSTRDTTRRPRAGSDDSYTRSLKSTSASLLLIEPLFSREDLGIPQSPSSSSTSSRNGRAASTSSAATTSTAATTGTGTRKSLGSNSSRIKAQRHDQGHQGPQGPKALAEAEADEDVDHDHTTTTAPPNNNATATFSPQTFFQQARRTVQLFIVLKTFCSVLEGVLVGALLAAVKVDFWFVFAVITFLMNYIPALGGAISLIGPGIFCFLDPKKTFGDLVLTTAGGGVLHTFVGNIIEPSLFGNAFELDPIVVLFALVVWGALWGIVGAILSVPLTCCIKLALRPFVYRHPFALVTYYSLEFSLPPPHAWQKLRANRNFGGAVEGEGETPLQTRMEEV